MDLTPVINGKKYLLVEEFIKSESGMRKAVKRVIDYNGIAQSVGAVYGSWGSKHYTMKWLCPEEYISLANKEALDEAKILMGI